ncbi:MAG: cobyrinate a,c-diamide synthase [Gammaproteobacteria bacterium]|nr:cobyrinate a,c-diamide synthase [Gammaproteobacteria bacterium]
MMPVEQKPGFYLSAAHKSSGKTIVAVGICAALRERGVAVRPFKKGPDYIDPLWLTRAAHSPCINLDFNTQSVSQIRAAFFSMAEDAAVSIIEGNKGLHDGMSVDGSDSNAELAGLLNVPVILVLDTQGTTRGIAPLIRGYQQFDPRVNIAGVILNKVAGPRHEEKLCANIRAHTDLEVMGSISRNQHLNINERHIGLTPSNEIAHADTLIDRIRQVVGSCIDLDRLPGVPPYRQSRGVPAPATTYPASDVRIGIPRDRAFCFYYADDLESFRRHGARLEFFDTLEDETIPDHVEALFIGGGFPEVHMEALQNNASMRHAIAAFVAEGGPVYAECGGLMYLGQSIRWQGRTAKMVGALPLDVEMEAKPVGRGYVRLEETGHSPWGRLNGSSSDIHAHEFHYSRIRLLEEQNEYAYRVKRGWGMDGKHDGLVYRNVLASYAHLRHVAPVCWVSRFMDFVRETRKTRQPARSI